MRIVKPLNLLRKELESLADNGGDLTQIIPIDTKDEVGDLARASNKFLANLRTILAAVLEQAQVLVVAIEQISAGTEQMAQGATSQASETQYLTGQISEMASAAEEVAASSEETVKAMNLEELLGLGDKKCDEYLRTLSPFELDTLQGEVRKRIEEIQVELRKLRLNV